MKKFLILALSFVMLLGVVLPVGAAPLAPAKSGIFALVGRITEIGDNTVTVKVLSGNILARPYKLQTLTINVSANTRYLYKDGTLITPITFADLAVGDPVSIRGKLTPEGIWNAWRITKGASLRSLWNR